MDRTSLTFCAVSLMAAGAISWLAFPMAALDPDTVELAAMPQPAEMLDMVDVGDGFGELPVIELMGYYVENPPVVASLAALAEPEIRFGGC